MTKPFTTDEVVRAVGIKLTEERQARESANRELAERIDEYGNTIERRVEHHVREYVNSLGLKDGQDGQRGPQGEVGPEGPQGPPGPAGAIGAAGVTGERGPVGDPGPRGLAGDIGVAGPPGERGEKGERGADGYPGEARGLFDATAQYRAMDVVTHNGSEWRAIRDNPGELPGPGWMLGAKGVRGRPGEKGPAGERGAKGDRGERGIDGIGIDEITIADYSLMVLCSNGTVLSCSLLPAFEHYRREMGP